MLGAYSREEKKKKEQSRAYIIETRDLVVDFGARLDEHKKEFVNHKEREERKFMEISRKIDEKTCPHDDTVGMLKRHNEEQNGHMKDLANDISATKQIVQTVHDIAKGRKSVWKDIGAVALVMIPTMALITTIVIYILQRN